MLKINKLTLKNFFSYGNATNEVLFENNGTTLIKGENLDNSISGSNGSGKSSLIAALSYALYDKCIADVSKDNMINNINKKDMLVTVDFEKNNKKYHIERGRKIKNKGNYIQILESDKDITPDSITNANELLEKIVGMPHELFTRIVVFSAINTSFLDLPVKSSSGPSQTSMIEHLFGLTLLSNKAEVLKEHIKDTKNKVEGEQIRIDFLQKEHQRYNEQLIQAKKRMLEWSEKHKVEIQKLVDIFENIKDVDFNKQTGLFSELDTIVSNIKDCEFNIKEIETAISTQDRHITQIKSTQTRIVDWDCQYLKNIESTKSELLKLSEINIDEQKSFLTNINSRKESIGLCDKLITDLTIITTKNNEEIKKTKKELSHLVDEKCPYCLQDFKDVKLKIDECQFIIDTKSKENDETNSQVIEVKNELVNLRVEELDISSKLKIKDIKELTSLEIKKSSLVNKLSEIEQQKNPHLSSLEDLNNSLPISDEEIILLRDLLVEKRNDLVVLKATKDNISKQLIFKNFNDLMNTKNEKTNLESKIKEKETEENPHTGALLDLEKNKVEDVDYSKINEYNKRYEHQNFLLKLLTKKDSFVRKYLLDKYLPFLNIRLQKYLSDLGLPHKVEFTNDLSAKIIYFNRELDFGNLSHGQKSRINIALALAFRDVLCHLHDKTNVLLLDEVLDDGLDSIGVHSAASMLKKKAKEDNLNMFIISHRDEISNLFDNILVVQFKDGFSNIASKI